MQESLNEEILVRQMTANEVRDIAIAWAAKEGWNPGQTDAVAFYAADPEGFFVVEQNGQPAACIAAVRYGENFGAIGLFIAAPEFRHGEAGFLLARKALKVLHGRTIGVDGVLDKVEHYQKLGFSVAYHNVRYRLDALEHGTTSSHKEATIVDAATVPFADLVAYDRRCFPTEREAFLKQWITPPVRALAALDPADGKIIGYGTLRPCQTGSKIAPLFADDARTAEMLFDALAALAPEVPLFMDIPEPNEAAVRLVQKRRMVKTFEAVRMYNHPAPDLPLNRIFGVTSLELG